MGRRHRRAADQSWDTDTGNITAAERAPPQAPQSRGKQTAAPNPADGFTPLDPFPAAAQWFGADRLAWIAWAFVGLGIAVRLVRFLLDFPLWPDESYLAHNYLDRGYLDLLRALDYGQVAPLLYLWVQKTVVTICGFSEYSLRLYAFGGSIASLLLFRHLAGKLLQGIARLMAIGTFAVAYPLVRYSAEAKPYGSDVLVTLVLLVLLTHWRVERQRTRWLWGLAVAMPVAVLLSYPAMFVVPTVSLAMAIELVRSGTRRQWLAWLGMNAATAGGVALLFFVSARAQLEAAGPDMRTNWEQAFPPLHSARQMALFLLESHTSEAFSYPAGGARGASSLTTLCWLAALVLLVRGRRFWLATLCTLPLALNFTAAALHGYPYAGHSRVMLYMAPILCLLTGYGAAALLSVIACSPAFRRKWSDQSRLKPELRASVPVVAALVLLTAVAGITAVRDFLKPYKETCWQRNRDFARWFWSDKALDAELVCVSTDCKEPVSSAPGGDELASVYFCNQRIYSYRHAHRLPPQLDHVSKDRPLRCARFRPAAATEQDDARFKAWLRSMNAKYRLVAREKYPLTFFVHERELQYIDQVEMYEFVPVEERLASQAGTAAGTNYR